MWHGLVDAARARLAAKRGGGDPLSAIAEREALAEDRDHVRLDETLANLAQVDSELARILECSFFAGLGFPGALSRTGAQSYGPARTHHWRRSQEAGKAGPILHRS